MRGFRRLLVLSVFCAALLAPASAAGFAGGAQWTSRARATAVLAPSGAETELERADAPVVPLTDASPSVPGRVGGIAAAVGPFRTSAQEAPPSSPRAPPALA